MKLKRMLDFLLQKKTNSLLIYACFCVVFIFLCTSRLYNLGERPYHHDESLYATYSYQYASQHSYQFNPILHGPFLFTVQAGLFKLLGDSDYTGRLSSAISGIILALIASFLSYLVFAKFSYALSTLVFFTLSPSLSYFSRFLGMDMLLSMLALSLVYCLIKYGHLQKIRHLYLATLLACFMVCTKLNYLFYFFIFASFYGFMHLCAFWTKDPELRFFPKFPTQKTYFKKALKKHGLVLVLISATIFTALYSGFGQDWPGILDGLYRKMIPYWVGQHRMQRIRGPFFYYFPMLLQYELPLCLGLLFYLGRILSQSKKQAWLFFNTCIISVLIYVFLIQPLWNFGFATVFKHAHLQGKLDFFALVFMFICGFQMTWYHLHKKQFFLSFCIYWFWSSLYLYSYAGEKVPWLLVHMVFPGLLYVSVRLAKDMHQALSFPLKKRALGLVCITLLSWQTLNVLRANFIYPDHANNQLFYTHTSTQTKAMVDKILACKKKNPEFKVQLLKEAAVTWPFSWYLRHHHGWYTLLETPDANTDVFIQDKHRLNDIQNTDLKKYNQYLFNLREWWVPQNNKLTFKKYLNFVLFWEAYSPFGFHESVAFVKPSAMACWTQSHE